MSNCICGIFACPICSKKGGGSGAPAEVAAVTAEPKRETRMDAYVKLHMISETHGFAVEKNQNRYLIAYVSKGKDKEGKECLVKEAQSYSNGKMHAYPSPFIADFVIRKEILPLYKKEKSA